jgi:hypothetical protein
MSSLAFFYPVIRALSQGRIIRQIAAWVLRLQAIFVLITGFLLLILILKIGFGPGVMTTNTVASVIMSLFMLAGTLAVAQVFWFRGKAVLDLEDGQYTVIPVIAQILRCLGEVYATVMATIGLAGTAFFWIVTTETWRNLLFQLMNHDSDGLLREFGSETWRNLSVLLALIPVPRFYFENAFIFGLGFLFQLLLIGVVMLVAFYFLAEAVIVSVDIAMTLRRGLAVGGLRPDVASAAKPFSCPKCHSEQVPGSTFCDVCGERLS